MGCVWSSADVEVEGLRMKIIKEIAIGGFSTVFFCKNIDSGDKYAVKKIVAHSSEELKRIDEECELLSMFAGNLNIVDMLGNLRTDSISYIVFPFYSKGTVNNELKRRRENDEYLDEVTIITILRGICNALVAVHSKKFAHFDLKTDNILLSDNGVPLLTDFGSAVRVPVHIEDSRSHQKWLDLTAEHCSMPYRAPELFTCEIGSSFDMQVDLWSLGCCAYALCFLVSPFDLVYEKGGSIALAAQSPDRIPYSSKVQYNQRLISLIKRLIVVTPSERVGLSIFDEELKNLLETESNTSNLD